MKPPTPMLFDEISDLWDEIAETNSTEKQTEFVINHIKKDGLILDLCCGSGRHSIRLCKKGYEMVGLDISIRLLKIAKLKASGSSADLQLVMADMRFVPFKSEVFNAVLSLDSSFGYLPSEIEDILSLNEICRILKNKKFFLMDVFNRERLEQRFKKKFAQSLLRNLGFFLKLFPRFLKWKEYSNFNLYRRKYVDNHGNLVETWFFQDKRSKNIADYQHILRLYNFSQLQKLTQKTCLQLVGKYGNYDEKEYSGISPRLTVITQKSNNVYP